MTTFQAIIFGIIQGFTEFLPVSASAHNILVPYLLGWSTPTGAILGAMTFGAFLACLIYFRHDWASMISSLLQVIIFRKRPKTLDEILPLLIALALVPVTVGYYYFRSPQNALFVHPVWIAGSLIVFGLLLWLADTLNRRSKGMFDWNWLDALFCGMVQVLLLVPGCGRTTASLIGGIFRNYRRDAIAKFSFFMAAPILGVSSFNQLQGLSTHTLGDTTWFTFGIALVVTFLSGLLAIGGFMKHIQRKGFGQYVFYRFVLGTIVISTYWYRSRH